MNQILSLIFFIMAMINGYDHNYQVAQFQLLVSISLMTGTLAEKLDKLKK